jgi:hypothetical protein
MTCNLVYSQVQQSQIFSNLDSTFKFHRVDVLYIIGDPQGEAWLIQTTWISMLPAAYLSKLNSANSFYSCNGVVVNMPYSADGI